MIANKNHCHFVGVVVGDAEVRALPNNRSSAMVQIKISEHLPTRNGGIEIVEFVRLIAYNNIGKHLAKYAKPGVTLSVHGRHHCTNHGCEIRLTEPVALELRNCLECKTEFFVRDRGQRHCPEHQNPWLEKPQQRETVTSAQEPLTPKYPASE